jgi:hypothetical protein
MKKQPIQCITPETTGTRINCISRVSILEVDSALSHEVIHKRPVKVEGSSTKQQSILTILIFFGLGMPVCVQYQKSQSIVISPSTTRELSISSGHAVTEGN